MNLQYYLQILRIVSIPSYYLQIMISGNKHAIRERPILVLLDGLCWLVHDHGGK
jgi:hypothetical protein